MAKRLQTLECIRKLQRKLYLKAKAEPHKVQTQTRASWSSAVGLGVKPVGEPDAGNPHVRFDERDVETGSRYYRATSRLYRIQSFVTVRDFSRSATCYAQPNMLSPTAGFGRGFNW